MVDARGRRGADGEHGPRAGRDLGAARVLHDEGETVATATVAQSVVVLGLLTALAETPLFILPAIGLAVAGVWSGICITIKRLHDLDRPAWHWFLLMVPVYNIYLGFVLLFQKGTDGPNQFGPDPRAGYRAIP